jgi:anti-sigma B factor antagonist
MNVILREENGISTFVLDGRIDTVGAQALERALKQTLTDGRYSMVLDMAQVDYISSAGLRTLADALSQSRENGGDIKLAGVNPKVLRVFRIIGFDRFFSIHDSVAAATGEFTPAP